MEKCIGHLVNRRVDTTHKEIRNYPDASDIKVRDTMSSLNEKHTTSCATRKTEIYL